MADNELRIKVTLENGQTRFLDEIVEDAERAGQRAGQELEKEIQQGIKDGVEQGGKGISTRSLAIGTAAGQLIANGILGAIGKVGQLVSATLGSVTGNIDLANIQLDSINELESSLKRIGEFSKETSSDLQDFASSLQSTSTFGDEAIIKQLAFAQSLGATSDQSKKIVSAAADLAAATGGSLDTAVQQLTETLGGVAGRMTKVASDTRNLTEEQLKAGGAIDIVAKKFAGAAASQITTFSGAITQAKNTIGDFQEELGKVIVQSDSVRKVITAIEKVFSDLGKSINQDITGGTDPFESIILSAIDFARFMNDVVFGTIEDLVTLGRAGFGFFLAAAKVAFDGILVAIGNAASGIASFISFFDSDSALAAGLQNFADGAGASFKNSLNEIADAASNVGTAFTTLGDGGSEGLNTFLDGLEESILDEGLTIEIPAVITPRGSSEGDTDKGFISDKAAEKTEKNAKRIEKAASSTDKKIKDTSRSIVISNQQIAAGLAGAFTAVGTALARGDNLFEAFAKSILATIGDMAVQLGTAFIASGLGAEAVGKSAAALTGGPAIAAGIALAVIGGALKAFAGSGGSSTISPSDAPSVADASFNDSQFGNDVGGGGGFASSTAAPTIATDEDVQRQTNVEVVIEGSAIGLTGEDLGIEIVKVLEEAKFAGVELA